MDSEHAIISTKVMRDNPHFSECQIIGQLSDLLSRKIILIETEPEDLTGHADGQCQFLADGVLLINDLSCVAPSIWKRNLARLKKSQLAVVWLPYHPTDKVKAGWSNLEGNYVNFIATPRDLIVSTFNDQHSDNVVEAVIKEADPYKRQIRRVDTAVLNELGGGLRCFSWLY
jgi:agmatine/peptidylarginine deiminase